MKTLHREHKAEIAHATEPTNFSVMAFLRGLFVGGAVGATAMLLFAPRSGKRSRTKIQHRYDDFRDQMRESLEDAEEEVMQNAHHATASIRGMMKELENHR